jgi:hypothetical protein
MLSIAIRGKPSGDGEARLAAGDDIEDSRFYDAADGLRDDMGNDLVRWETASRRQPTVTAGLR